MSSIGVARIQHSYLKTEIRTKIMTNMAETKPSILKRITQAKILGVLGFVFSIVTASSNFATDGQPVAIRYWPNNCVSIETMWNLHIVIGVDTTSRQLLP